MLDIGLTELMIILVVALIVLGPQKLPEIARKLGRGLAEFRRTSEDLRRSILLEDETKGPPPFTDAFPSTPKARTGEKTPKGPGKDPSAAPTPSAPPEPEGALETSTPKNRDEGVDV